MGEIVVISLKQNTNLFIYENYFLVICLCRLYQFYTPIYSDCYIETPWISIRGNLRNYKTDFDRIFFRIQIWTYRVYLFSNPVKKKTNFKIYTSLLPMTPELYFDYHSLIHFIARKNTTSSKKNYNYTLGEMLRHY